MAVGKKIAAGFGVVLTLLAVAGFLSYAAVSSIVNNAGQVIDGNVMDGILAQKILSRKQIRVVSTHVGGQKGRKYVFNTSTNEIGVFKVDKLRKKDWYPYENDR